MKFYMDLARFFNSFNFKKKIVDLYKYYRTYILGYQKIISFLYIIFI